MSTNWKKLQFFSVGGLQNIYVSVYIWLCYLSSILQMWTNQYEFSIEASQRVYGQFDTNFIIF